MSDAPAAQGLPAAAATDVALQTPAGTQQTEAASSVGKQQSLQQFEEDAYNKLTSTRKEGKLKDKKPKKAMRRPQASPSQLKQTRSAPAASSTGGAAAGKPLLVVRFLMYFGAFPVHIDMQLFQSAQA